MVITLIAVHLAHITKLYLKMCTHSTKLISSSSSSSFITVYTDLKFYPFHLYSTDIGEFTS